MHDDLRGDDKNLVIWTVVRKSGEVETGQSHNLRTANGATWQANQMAGSPTTIARHIGLTENATAPDSADTNLASEITVNGLSRTTGTLSYTAGASRYTLTATWVCSGSTYTIAKAGLSSHITNLDTSADTLVLATLVRDRKSVV